MNAIPAVLSVSHSIGLCILIGVIILCLEILYHRKKDEHERKNARKRFWEKEAEANSVRKKDITFLNYIDIPLESLPFIHTDDDELNEYQNIVKDLAGKRILNLGGISNTDLKLEYGPANLPELMQYDDNYNTLTATLAKWGSRLASIGMSDLPFIHTDDDELNEYQNIVKDLAGKRILNLGGISNTDLKLEYGPANLPELMQYDDNYNTLTATLAKWGSRLASIGMSDRAIMVLEYSIDIGSDVSLAYYTLADEYRKKGRTSDIDELIKKAEKLDSIMKKAILEKLNTIRSYID